MTEWKPVKNYETVYEVSNTGLVRKCDGRLLKQSLSNHGYPRVSLNLRTRYVHQLVAEAFIGDRPEKADVNHIDGCKTNNAVSNLEYLSRSENIRHAIEHGLIKIRRGRETGCAKLSDKDIVEIRNLLAEGVLTQKQIGAMYGVSYGPIGAIKRDQAWKHVKG